MFTKVLVANRGEIAVRVLRALGELGIGSVAVYTAVDRSAWHVRMAEEVEEIDSYLNVERIVDVARRRGAGAIHPGYGFLSENPAFTAACDAAGVVFIGPSAETIRRMGSKTEARRLAIAAGVPVVPGTESALADLDEARRVATGCGYPVMLKAAAGGGGKGMRLVAREADLEAALREAASEAERAFGSGEVYIEKWIERPRHIEIQVFGDRHGNLIHLGERECSIQRRHQKVVEECPSPLVEAHPELREAMGEAALRTARAAGYHNAGTVEFLVDADRRFYFLEMNTRLQVEHPVTELVTGLDLVEMQIRVAAGERLPLAQEDVAWRGSAIECRIYAEDPENSFFPSPGRITHLREPAGPGVRLDSGVYAGWRVPLEYDPLLAKLAAWGSTRERAIARLARALEEYAIGGIKSNLALFRQILAGDRFRRGDLDTSFLDGMVARASEATAERETVAALVAALAAALAEAPERIDTAAPSRWRSEGRESLLRE
ncbi:MAG: acetyl-CoA carboxylase biotin carboxylase subunit [Bryobacteraceae bacterium]